MISWKGDCWGFAWPMQTCCRCLTYIPVSQCLTPSTVLVRVRRYLKAAPGCKQLGEQTPKSYQYTFLWQRANFAAASPRVRRHNVAGLSGKPSDI